MDIDTELDRYISLIIIAFFDHLLLLQDGNRSHCSASHCQPGNLKLLFQQPQVIDASSRCTKRHSPKIPNVDHL